MLHRVIYASEAVGATGTSTLSIAQILGLSERNNRRDQLTSCVMFHQGHVLQAIEGERADIDRLIRRLLADPRHTGLRILTDSPIAVRRIGEPMGLCADPPALLRRIGLDCLSRITAREAEMVLDLRQAA
ncbi:BLUF domain-containing protein [uncultured Brevundimonas sp.]|uniref:BLUF domain-containing protein n=1 Tax=uncultured Brevundimonas sp. TaxID=213418 RepID=UPI002622CDB1|nr:BLUF domain-containing protein [uncultured Brevundimonas sp.]